MPSAALGTVHFERNTFAPDPGRKFSALDLPCDCGADVGESCKGARICSVRLQTMRALIVAGEAGPGQELVRKDWREQESVFNGVLVSAEIQRQRYRAKLGPNTRLSELAMPEVVRLREAGMTIKDIAARFKVSPQTITNRLKQYRARKTG